MFLAAIFLKEKIKAENLVGKLFHIYSQLSWLFCS